MTVPASLFNPTLSFVYQLGRSLPSSATWLSAALHDGAGATMLFSTTVTGGWEQRWIDLSPWRGRAVSLTFAVHQAAGAPPTWAYLDEITVGSAYPDLWIAQDAPGEILPSQLITLTLAYGNRGGALGHGVQISATLPAALRFVRAAPPPDSAAPVATWRVGDLAASSGPLTITLIVQAAAAAPWLSTVDYDVAIGSAAAELEQRNNAAQGATFIGYRRWMPVIERQEP